MMHVQFTAARTAAGFTSRTPTPHTTRVDVRLHLKDARFLWIDGGADRNVAAWIKIRNLPALRTGPA